MPYAYSITLIGYNVEKMKELGLPTDTWAVIFDPKYLEKVKGKVTVLDSQRELFAAALIYLGYPVNETDPAKLKEARDTILRAKPYWAAFNASSYIKELTIGNIWLAHGYSNDMFQAAQDAAKAKRPFSIGYSTPKQGAVLAVDNMVMHKTGPREDLAYQFINFMLEGKNSAELSNMLGSGNPNAAAMPFIDPEVKDNPAVFPDPGGDEAARAAARPAAQGTAPDEPDVDRDQGPLMTRDCTRASNLSDIAVAPLAPDRVDDFLRFFDHERGPAFADNPEWAKCYCHYYQVPRAIDWPSLPGDANRVAMRSRIAGGRDGRLSRL